MEHGIITLGLTRRERETRAKRREAPGVVSSGVRECRRAKERNNDINQLCEIVCDACSERESSSWVVSSARRRDVLLAYALR